MIHRRWLSHEYFSYLPGYTLPPVSLRDPREKMSLGNWRSWTGSGTLIIVSRHTPQTRASPVSVIATIRSSEHRKDWILYGNNMSMWVTKTHYILRNTTLTPISSQPLTASLRTPTKRFHCSLLNYTALGFGMAAIVKVHINSTSAPAFNWS